MTRAADYDAFISYSHAADGELAPQLQRGLEQLAKPWSKRRALRVFRDDTGLSASPDLWDSIVAGLDGAKWFVVLASPDSAASVWVNREIEHWLASSPDARERLLPVVTGGIWRWDEASNGFSSDSTAVPPAIREAFHSEPRHLDLSWARDDEHLDLRRAEFRSAIADLAAPMHGIPKDDLESDDIRIHRRTVRLRRAAVASLAAFAVAVAALAVVALVLQNRAARSERGGSPANRPPSPANRPPSPANRPPSPANRKRSSGLPSPRRRRSPPSRETNSTPGTYSAACSLSSPVECRISTRSRPRRTPHCFERRADCRHWSARFPTSTTPP